MSSPSRGGERRSVAYCLSKARRKGDGALTSQQRPVAVGRVCAGDVPNLARQPPRRAKDKLSEGQGRILTPGVCDLRPPKGARGDSDPLTTEISAGPTWPLNHHRTRAPAGQPLGELDAGCGRVALKLTGLGGDRLNRGEKRTVDEAGNRCG